MRKLIALFVFVGLLATFSLGCNDSSGSKSSGSKTSGSGSGSGSHSGSEPKKGT